MTSHSFGLMEKLEAMAGNNKTKPQTSFAVALLLGGFLILEQFMFRLLLCIHFQTLSQYIGQLIFLQHLL